MAVSGQPGSARRVCSSFHGAWDRDLEPALELEDRDIVELHVPDASRDQIGERAVVADLASVDFDLMNPVAGPVFVRGARPGDVRGSYRGVSGSAHVLRRRLCRLRPRISPSHGARPAAQVRA